MSNMEFWNKVRQPPAEALKKIEGGRLRGKTDINPQWRYEAMTEHFGPIGTGWRYEITRTWTEPGAAGEIMAFATVALYVKSGDEWSAPIIGIGGSMLIEKETSGLHSNDEAYKMAVTDALSVALKTLGVAADVYAGRWDGTKYQDKPVTTPRPASRHPAPDPDSEARVDGTVEGKIEAFSRREDPIAFRIGSDWFNTFDADVAGRLKAAKPLGAVVAVDWKWRVYDFEGERRRGKFIVLAAVK